MPKVALAATVLWYPDKNTDDCHAGIVTKVGDRSISILVCLPELQFAAREGVRHRNDPDVEVADRLADGVWDYSASSEDSQYILELAKAVNAIKARLDKLESR